MSFLNSHCIYVELNSKCQREISLSKAHWKLTIFILIDLSLFYIVLICHKCNFNYMNGDLNSLVGHSINCYVDAKMWLSC